MYASLSAAKAAVLQAGEEVRTNGLPFQISPLVFIFTGSGKGKKGQDRNFEKLPLVQTEGYGCDDSAGYVDFLSITRSSRIFACFHISLLSLQNCLS